MGMPSWIKRWLEESARGADWPLPEWWCWLLERDFDAFKMSILDGIASSCELVCLETACKETAPEETPSLVSRLSSLVVSLLSDKLVWVDDCLLVDAELIFSLPVWTDREVNRRGLE